MKTKKPILAVDCDGVIANFTTTTLHLLNRYKGSSHTEDEITQWDFIEQFLGEEKKLFRKTLNSHELFSIIKPYKEAQEAIEELKEYARIYVVTSPMQEYHTWVRDRDEWLLNHFGIKRDNVIHTRAKYRVHSNFFVEDKPSTLKKWKKEWPKEVGVLFKHNGNLTAKGNWDLHTNDWQKIIDRIKHA